MLVKTILIFLITLLGYSEWLLGTSMIQRPIVLGALVGAAMGNLTTGVIMGATLELAMVGAVSVGAYNPPDLVAGTVLGVALAIQSHASPAAALTLGIPVATIMLAVNTALGQPPMLLLIHACDRDAAKANTRAFSWHMFLAGYAQSWPGLLFIPLAFFFGSAWVTRLLGHIPSFINDGMNVAAGILPILGFAMLMQMIMNKKVAAFFFIGFFMVAYLKISTTGVAIFAILIALVLYIFVDKTLAENNQSSVVRTSDKDDDRGDFDEF